MRDRGEGRGGEVVLERLRFRYGAVAGVFLGRW